MTNAPIPLSAWRDLFFLSFLWGGSFLAVAFALDEIGPLSSVTHRVLWAALMLWAVVLIRRETIPRAPAIWGAFLVMGALNNVIPFSLMAWGQQSIESGLASILNGATALWGVLIAALVFADERLTRARIFGVLTGFAGVVLTIGPDALAGFDPRALGQLAVLAGTLSYALAGSWARAKLGGVPPIMAAAGMLTGSSLMMLPLAHWMEGPLPLDLSPVTWGAIAYAALASTALAYLLYYRILAVAGAGNLLLVTLMIPPIGILLGALLRGEYLATQAYLGLALIALGLIILDGRWQKIRARD